MKWFAAVLVAAVLAACVVLSLVFCVEPSPIVDRNREMLDRARQQGLRLARAVAIFIREHPGAQITWDNVVESTDVKCSELIDPWGVPYEIFREGPSGVGVVSLGPDEMEFTEDDLEFRVVE